MRTFTEFFALLVPYAVSVSAASVVSVVFVVLVTFFDIADEFWLSVSLVTIVASLFVVVKSNTELYRLATK